MSDEENQEEEVENIEGEEAESFDDVDDDDEDGGGNKLLIIIGAAVLIIVGAGAGLYFSGMLDGFLGKKECVEEVDEDGKVIKECPKEDNDKKEDKGGKGGTAAFLEIPTMIVNLNTESGTPRYLRLTVQLELSSPGDVESVESVLPRVVDQFQTYLRELRVKDLRGSAGIYRLQMELLWRVNQAAAPIEVKDVLFQEILIQ